MTALRKADRNLDIREKTKFRHQSGKLKTTADGCVPMILLWYNNLLKFSIFLHEYITLPKTLERE